MNRFLLSCALLLAGLLSSTATHAQTPLGQPTLDEQKVQIWCATVRYVYDDNNRPNLKSGLNCDGTLSEFVSSIKADSQKVYSMLYQPLEGKGTMYKGLGSDASRLQKLTTEIINKLQASPARKADAARMAKLNTLKSQLATYLSNGTPPADLNNDVTAGQEETEDTSVADEAALAATDAGVGQGAAEATTTAPRAASSESLMSKFFAPLALILSLLSIFLYVMLRSSLGKFQKELSSRIDKRREEIASLQSSPATGTASGAALRLTPELQRDIEKLVQQRVAEELSKRQGSGQPQSQSQGKQPQQQQRNQSNQQQSNPPRQAPPVAVPTPQPQSPPVAQAPAPVPPVVRPVAAPVSLQEAAPLPPVVPAGPPASTPRDEFDSLIPPVQLPATDWSAATAEVPPVPQPAVPQPAAPQPMRYYVKVPVNGGFSDYDLQDQPQHDSIYEITPDPRVPERATFRVTSNVGVHAYAIQSAQYSLREACAYQQPSGPVSRIVTDKDGTLIKSNGAWQIEQKAAIHFE
ncbi:hypothetical protein [Hymenobacter lucidus]|uniref:Uncharacterized protein n=1 Tax=Hymenobacter lucidus TaxID=2880930 RepID=A0ABS8ASZ6_9BACT|nr:hypothetical protein [Hymenobacter lucidus]MCB2409325.1 hypothetical protein [Hymenobacter lucidus]